MKKPIALQLYTVREALARDFTRVMKEVASMGYPGVETDEFPAGTTPENAARLFKELGLVVCAAHSRLPLGDRKNEVLDTMAALHCDRIISGSGKEQFKSLEGVKAVCDTFNKADDIARPHGISIGYHNHWWEFQRLNGRTALETMLDYLQPEVFFEIDTYWVKTSGYDPSEIVRKLGKRAPFLHIKDGPATKEDPMVAVGEGILDFPTIIRAAGDSVEWLVVELDRCATDMVEAARKSIRYLTGNGLGYGR
jgi:sugar phosphate isomerase/epimerase